MPFINVKISENLSDTQVDNIKSSSAKPFLLSREKAKLGLW